MNNIILPDLIDLCKEFVRLDKIKKSQKLDLEDIQLQLDALDLNIQNGFSKKNLQNISVDGRTVYLNSQLWVSKEEDCDEEAFFRKLDEEGIGDSVKKSVNTQTLSSYYRQKIEENKVGLKQGEKPEPPFPSLDPFVKKITKYKIKSTKSK